MRLFKLTQTYKTLGLLFSTRSFIFPFLLQILSFFFCVCVYISTQNLVPTCGHPNLVGVRERGVLEIENELIISNITV